jgi:hypothetical protein
MSDDEHKVEGATAEGANKGADAKTDVYVPQPKDGTTPLVVDFEGPQGTPASCMRSQIPIPLLASTNMGPNTRRCSKVEVEAEGGATEDEAQEETGRRPLTQNAPGSVRRGLVTLFLS